MSETTDKARREQSDVAARTGTHASREDNQQAQRASRDDRETAEDLYRYVIGGANGQMPDLRGKFPGLHLFWAIADNPAHPQSAQNYRAHGYRYVLRSEMKENLPQLSFRVEDGQEVIRFNELVLMALPESVYVQAKRLIDEDLVRRAHNRYQASVEDNIREVLGRGGKIEEMEGFNL